MRLAFLVSPGANCSSEAKRLVLLLDFDSSKCLRPERSCVIFPVPVFLKRFLAPLCVFIFGIYLSLVLKSYSVSEVLSALSRATCLARTASDFLLFGAKTMTMFRPSCLGANSTMLTSAKSSAKRASNL